MCSTQNDSDAEFVADLAQHVGGLIHFALVEPAKTFVGEQKFWRGGERFGQFELLQTGSAETFDAHMPVARQPDHGQRPLGGRFRFRATVATLTVEACQHHIVENAQAVKRPRDLEGAPDPLVCDAVWRTARDLAPMKTDRAGGRRQGAG